MKYEKSCGVIVFSDNKVLMVKQNSKEWSIPKGHVENNETEIETALREVKEEVGLDVEIDATKRYTLNYIIKDEIDKTTVLYLAKAKNDNILMQDSEIENVKWCSYKEALDTLTFNDWKELFNKVINDIK